MVAFIYPPPPILGGKLYYHRPVSTIIQCRTCAMFCAQCLQNKPVTRAKGVVFIFFVSHPRIFLALKLTGVRGPKKQKKTRSTLSTREGTDFYLRAMRETHTRTQHAIQKNLNQRNDFLMM